MSQKIKTLMGSLFALAFLAISLFLVCLAGYQFYTGLQADKDLINIFVQTINTTIVSLAIFELGIGIGKEYAAHQEEEEKNTYFVVRRTIARFVGTVCIALVLESLIMIIKYSQLELAGNLYYPVGILIGASVLLIGMGVFLALSRPDSESEHPSRSHSSVEAWRRTPDRRPLPAPSPWRRQRRLSGSRAGRSMPKPLRRFLS